MFSYYSVVFFALAGFVLAFYIRRKKSSNHPLICPLKSNCHTVIHSEYSKFFGIPVEIIGLFYYILVAGSYAFFLKFPGWAISSAVFAALIMTGAALTFSLYLTFIQTFALKQWCLWCLMSAGLCLVIFVSALAGLGENLTFLLAEQHLLIKIFHIFGVTLGLGGATISDIFFFKFLKDFRISKEEAGVLRVFSQIIWFALAVIVLSGLGLYLSHMEELNQSPKFLVKMLIVGVVIINGALLNLLISPKLIKISFAEKYDRQAGGLRRLRRLAFALGAVSFISWYFAFVLGMLHSLSVNFWPLLSVYLLFLTAALIISQLTERVLAKRTEMFGN